MGDKTPPCLTPLTTPNWLDISSPHLTHHLWFVYMYINNLITSGDICLLESSLNNLQYLTRSNALVASNNNLFNYIQNNGELRCFELIWFLYYKVEKSIGLYQPCDLYPWYNEMKSWLTYTYIFIYNIT